MLRQLVLVGLVAAAAAVPVESDTEFCNGQTECPQDCGFVSRNSRCVFCRCGGPNHPLIHFGPLPLPDPESTQCQYGPGYIDECGNDCKCLNDGRYGCTRKACPPGQRTMQPKTCKDAGDLPKRAGQRVSCHEGIVKLQRENADCLPGAVFKDAEDCNTCVCSDSGVAGCTLKLCPKDERQCRHGPGFIDECDNDCNCLGDGRYGCTRKLCMVGQRPEQPKTCKDAEGLPKRAGQRVFCHDGIVKYQPEDASCVPGSAFKDADDCNDCFCSDNGGVGCTLKLCFAELPEEKPQGCPYGPGFIDECNNDCDCVDGRFYGCTRKACKSGERPEVPMKCTSSDNLPSRTGQHVLCDEGVVKLQKKEDGCEYGPGFIDECNNDCKCLDGSNAYGCTRKACKSGGQPEVPMKCTSSDSLPSRAGVRVFCSEGIVKLAKPVCPHGDEFIDECGNDCRCLEHGYACSRKACKPGQISMKPLACSGTQDLPSRPGRRVFCHESIVKVQDEAAACLPGAVFPDECNDCFCSDNGKSGCTLKACLGRESESTVTCEDGLPECPQDCGQVYNKARDCYDCPCSVGGPGDITVDLGEPCPPGTKFTDSGAFFKSCGPVEQCSYGLEYIDECDNDCSCMAGGYACTRKACRPGQTSEKPMTCMGSANLPERKGMRVFCHEGVVKMQDEQNSCIPGSVFKDDCNSCFCSDGGQAGCTFKACLEKKSESCAHGPAFIDECDNDCACDEKGGFYGCTRKACMPGQTPEKPLTCDGALDLPERFQQRVICHDGIVKLQRNDEQCLPGSVYKDDCNTCTCGGGCTFMACPPRPYN